MDGRGAWRDNVFVERLWRTIKYEEVYLHAYQSVSQARTSIETYLRFYNARRPHSSLDRNTPDQAYFIPPQHNPRRRSTYRSENPVQTNGTSSNYYAAQEPTAMAA